ncbi:MAG: ATP-binding cassette domain-containing protein [Opitutales bacterium]|nr:ATP-binding cassette domain-containing protein [Opitutales bacterium]NRA25920.1 ABC-F family ATP-binding cassette domain-containing protein [Opitutales bacterium]
MIDIKDLTLRFGERYLFQEISAHISMRDRIALVGANGTGKSTLLKVLMGEQKVDTGEIDKAGTVKIGYLPQDGISAKGKTLYKEVETAFGDALELKEQIAEAEEKMYELDPDSEEYYDVIDMLGDLEQQLENYEPEKMKSRIERILIGLGFYEKDFERDTEEFSGGWQMRIALAKLLLANPSLLLLDEPTNHLDIVSQNWLEHYLANYPGALMVISHDKAFLDAVTSKTFEVKFGKLNSYAGNYSFYETEREARLEQQRKAYENQKKEITRQKELINRFRGNVKKAGMVQSRIKALDKIEVIKPEREEKKIWFRFAPPPPASQKVVILNEVRKCYEDHEVFRDLSLRIDKGDRIAVVGVNGAGKSTLARIIAGVEPLTDGTIDVGLNTVIAYFAQQQAEELDSSKTVLQEVESSIESANKDANPRGALGAMLFSGDDHFKSVSVLSGGERNRVALAKMLMKPANFIILDEPTNHLDIKSKEVLQDAIREFDGTILLVSHDRDFLDPVVNKVLEVSKTGLRMLSCNVSEYIKRMEAESDSGLS